MSAGADPGRSEREKLRILDVEIAEHREALSSLVAELDARRHAILNLRRHVKRYALPMALSGMGVIAAVSATMWLIARLAHRRARRRAPGDQLLQFGAPGDRQS